MSDISNVEIWAIHPTMPEPSSWEMLEHVRRNWNTTPITGRSSLPKYARFAAFGARWIQTQAKGKWVGSSGASNGAGPLLILHENNVFTVTACRHHESGWEHEENNPNEKKSENKSGEENKNKKTSTIDLNTLSNLSELYYPVYRAASDSSLRKVLREEVGWMPLVDEDWNTQGDDVVRNFVVIFFDGEQRAYPQNRKKGTTYLREEAALALLLKPDLGVNKWPEQWDGPENWGRMIGANGIFKNQLHIYLGTRAMIVRFMRRSKGGKEEDYVGKWKRQVKDSLLDYAEDLVSWHYGLTYALARIDEVTSGLFGPTFGTTLDEAERFLANVPKLMWNPGLYEEHSITAKWLQFETADRVFDFSHLEQMLRDKINILQNAILISKMDAIRLLLRDKEK